MGSKEKDNKQFDDELAFARYIIKNGDNFMLLPLDKSTVAQLNYDMRLHCIDTRTFINSIKHILAEQKSPTSFRPIKMNEFTSILNSNKQTDDIPIDSYANSTTANTDSNKNDEYYIHFDDDVEDKDYMPANMEDDDAYISEPIAVPNKTTGKKSKKEPNSEKKILKTTKNSVSKEDLTENLANISKKQSNYNEDLTKRKSTKTVTPYNEILQSAEETLKRKAEVKIENLKLQAEAALKDSRSKNKLVENTSKNQTKVDITSDKNDTNTTTTNPLPTDKTLETRQSLVKPFNTTILRPEELSSAKNPVSPNISKIASSSASSIVIPNSSSAMSPSKSNTSNSTTEQDRLKNLKFWINLRESQIVVKNPPDFTTFNAQAVLDAWEKEVTPELNTLKHELKDYSMETWNIRFLTFLKKHRFNVLANKSKRLDGPTPFHGLENKFLTQFLLPYLFPDIRQARDPYANKYFRHIKKALLGKDIYLKLHDLRTPPLDDLTSVEKITAWLERLKPAFYLLTNKLSFNEVYAVSFCISHYSKGEYNKTLKIWRQNPNLASALNTGAAIFRKLAKLEHENDKAQDNITDKSRDKIDETNPENTNFKKRPAETLEIAPQSTKKPTLDNTEDTRAITTESSSKVRPEEQPSNNMKNSKSISSGNIKMVPESWLNIHADQPTTLRALNFDTFNEEKVISGWIQQMGPKVLPLMDELDSIEAGDRFLDWACKFIKILEAEHFTTMLRQDINRMRDDLITPIHEAEDTFLYEKVFKTAFPDIKLSEYASSYDYWEAIKTKMYPDYKDIKSLFNKQLHGQPVNTLKSKRLLNEWLKSLDKYHSVLHNSTFNTKQLVLINEFMKYCSPNYYDEVDTWKTKPYQIVANKIVEIMNKVDVTSSNNDIPSSNIPTTRGKNQLPISTSFTTTKLKSNREIAIKDTEPVTIQKEHPQQSNKLVINTAELDLKNTKTTVHMEKKDTDRDIPTDIKENTFNPTLNPPAKPNNKQITPIIKPTSLVINTSDASVKNSLDMSKHRSTVSNNLVINSSDIPSNDITETKKDATEDASPKQTPKSSFNFNSTASNKLVINTSTYPSKEQGFPVKPKSTVSNPLVGHTTTFSSKKNETLTKPTAAASNRLVINTSTSPSINKESPSNPNPTVGNILAINTSPIPIKTNKPVTNVNSISLESQVSAVKSSEPAVKTNIIPSEPSTSLSRTSRFSTAPVSSTKYTTSRFSTAPVSSTKYPTSRFSTAPVSSTKYPTSRFSTMPVSSTQYPTSRYNSAIVSNEPVIKPISNLPLAPKFKPPSVNINKIVLSTEEFKGTGDSSKTDNLIKDDTTAKPNPLVINTSSQTTQGLNKNK